MRGPKGTDALKRAFPAFANGIFLEIARLSSAHAVRPADVAAR
jgi:hypothetical protein